MKDKIYRLLPIISIAAAVAAIYALFYFLGHVDLSDRRLQWQPGVSVNAAPAVPPSTEAIQEPQYGAVTPYSTLSYFDEEKVERYNAFLKKHPKYGEEVIWRVNADQDLSWDMEERISITEKEPLLVNKHYKLSKSYVPELTTVEGAYQSTPETAKAYQTMKEAAAKQGMGDFMITSAYRSYEYQQQLFDSYRISRGETVKETAMYSAYAGSSEHQTGRALDLCTPGHSLNDFGATKESQWIYKHSYKFGFIVRYYASETKVTGIKDEPWHITYVGKAIAKDMHKEKIRSLEEYLAKHPEVTGL